MRRVGHQHQTLGLMQEFQEQSDATAKGWLAWRAPRRIGTQFETPYHHVLVEVRLCDEAESRTIRPIDLPSDWDVERTLWRPMPWSIDGGRRPQRSTGLGPETVFEGEDEHLFAGTQAAFEQIIEGEGLTDQGCARWVELLQRRLDWCGTRGIAYRLAVIPDHHAVYPDKIVGRPSPSADRPIMRILRAASPELREAIVYPLEAMVRGRSTHETCLPHDVHFTSYGAFLCYREIMRTLPDFSADRVVRDDEITNRTSLIAGDVARAAGWPARKIEQFGAPHLKLRTVVKTATMTDNQVDVFETEDPALPRLVMFRSSNSASFFPLLARHFSRITAMSGLRMYRDLVESEAPQVVITEMLERYLACQQPRWEGDRDLCNAPTEDDSVTFEGTTGHKLPLLAGSSA